MSQLTTHILDTTTGQPAQGVSVILFEQGEDLPEGTSGWRQIAIGTTDKDGRITNLLNEDAVLETGIYKLRFETKDYFDRQSYATFYPYIEIVFDIKDKEHYHVPLLLNPFGYSTYRGS